MFPLLVYLTSRRIAIAWIPEEKGSWALPLRHERITSFEAPIGKAAWQLRKVTKSLNKPVLAL